MKATARRTGQLSIIRFMRPIDNRRQRKRNFQTRVQDARRAALPTSSNTVDGDRSSDEPPDKVRDYNVLIPFHPYIQILI